MTGAGSRARLARNLPQPHPILSVVVPAFNEDRTIAEVIHVLSGLPLDLEIIVVDDCSTDRTHEILVELAKTNERLHFLRHQKNAGKTAAVRTGIGATTGEIVIIQDADLEQDPKDIPAIIQPIIDGKAVASFGSRFLDAQLRQSMSFTQWVGNKCVTLFSNLLADMNLTDVETGYKAIRGDVCRRMILTSSAFGMEVEIPAKLAKLKVVIGEVPISYKARTYDAGKKIGIWDGVTALWYILKFNLLTGLSDSFRPEEESGTALGLAKSAGGWKGSSKAPPTGDQSCSAESSTSTAPDGSWMASIRTIRHILGVLLLLSVATSALYFHHFHDYFENADTPGYIAPAANLLAGHGFTDTRGNPDTIITPGYPLLILPFLWAHLDLKYLIVLQHLLRVWIVLATTVFAFRLTGSRRQSLLAGLVLCIDFPMLKSANDILTEIMFTVVLGTVLILLWHESRQAKPPGLRLLAAGLLAGASVLVRPVGLFFFLPAATYLLVARKTYKFWAAVGFVLLFALIPLLWAGRNYRQTGYFTVSSIAGYNILQCRAAGVLAVNDPGEFYANLEKRRYEVDAIACRDWERAHGRDCSQMGIPEQSQYYSRYGSKIVLQHPFAYLKLAGRGVAMTMLTGSPATLSGITGINFNLAAKLLLIYTVPAFCLAVFGLKDFWNRNRAFFWLAALVCVYFVGISAGAESFSRFRVPIMPVYSILIAAGVDSALQKFVGGRRTRSKSVEPAT